MMSYNPRRAKSVPFKWLAVLTVLVMLFAALPGGPLNTVAAAQTREEKIAALQAANSQLDDRIAAAQSQLSGAEDEQELTLEKINNVYEQIQLIEEQISSYEGEVAVINTQIGECDANITSLAEKISAMEEAIAQKEADIQENYNLFKKRMRSLYMTGEVSTLTVLFNSEDFADYLLKTEISKKVAKHDRELIETLKNDITELNNSKTEVETSKADLESQKAKMVENREAAQAKLDEVNQSQAQLAQRQTELETLYQENSNLTSRLSQDIRNAQSQIAANKAAMEAATDDLDKTVNEDSANSGNSGKPSGGSSGSTSGGSSSGSNTPSSSSGFIWPVPGYAHQITSGYGPRWGSFHYGIDISGYAINGKDIVASMSGTVTTVQWSNSGYGNYVAVTHDGGYVTVYAHCSTLLVSKGQYVQQGQVIARVGSTGNSTGPHLHFEVRVNGSKMNPINYLP